MGAKQFKIALGTVYASYLQEMNPTFKDLLDFVLANKTNKSFVGHEEATIINMLESGLNAGSLYFEQNLDGSIAGMVLAQFDHTNKIAFVEENLSMDINRLGRFAAKLKREHPELRIEAMRHGKHRKFDTEKFYKKLI